MIKNGDKMNKRNIYNEIKVMQVKLDENVEKHGLDHEKTIEISKQIDIMINYYLFITKTREYPSESIIKKYYDISYEALKKYTEKYSKFPSVNGWNRLAKKKKYLCSEAIKYITILDWNYLRAKVEREINMKMF